MEAIGYALFDTALGRCAVAWSDLGIVALQLPERDDSTTRARLTRRFGEIAEANPPPDIARAIGDVVTLLAGETTDLGWIALDLDGVPDFERRVYEAARTIRPGTTSTYGALAAVVGSPEAARAVGRALGFNRIPVIVPCHRVVAADGELGGFSAPGGTNTKRRMLLIEGYAAAAPQLALFD